MLKKIFLLIILSLMLFMMSGCSETKNDDNKNTRTQIELRPMLMPDGRGHFTLKMMPVPVVRKGE